MGKTITVEGPITAVDTATNLGTQGSTTSPSLVLPRGTTKIKHIYAAVGPDHAAAGGAVYLMRLGGNAVKDGEQVIVLAASGGQDPQAGSDTAPNAMWSFELKNADISVRADTIKIQGEMAGSDMGTTEMAVTLIVE